MLEHLSPIESSLALARPRRGTAETLDLTPEEKERVDILLSQAKQAETAAKQEPNEQKRIALYEQALDLYTQVKTDLLSIKEKKEKEKRGEKGEALFREMRELFKEGFLGLEEVETAFTLQDGSKLIELTPEEQQEAFRLLEAKLQEPDIKEFLQKTPKRELAENWLLVLRLPELQDNTPLTMKALEERLAPDMLDQNQGKLLLNTDWYQSETFYTTDTVKAGAHWQFVTREVAPKTKGKDHPTQTQELKKAAQAVHLDPAKTRRRAPVETLFDSFISLRSKGQRILETEYDWSNVRSSDGSLVDVGYCGALGAHVNRWRDPENSHGFLGASLSR